MHYPEWLKKRIPKSNINIRRFLANDVHTVCESALCPNRGECFQNGTVTFMIMGDVCTRSCTFCSVNKGLPVSLDNTEPEKVASSAKKLNLKHVVITSVTRDDLPDGGAGHFAATIKAVRQELPEATIEVLIPDILENLEVILMASPDVLNHNIETIERLYPQVRPQANFKKSLAVLSPFRSPQATTFPRFRGARAEKKIIIKSGFMVGLGETKAEVFELLEILKSTGVDIITIGQYIAPSKQHYPVKEFIAPEVYGEYKKYGEEKLGFRYVFAGPFVRSSYLAEKVLNYR